jgi:hypothetical protein
MSVLVEVHTRDEIGMAVDVRRENYRDQQPQSEHAGS